MLKRTNEKKDTADDERRGEKRKERISTLQWMWNKNVQPSLKIYQYSSARFSSSLPIDYREFSVMIVSKCNKLVFSRLIITFTNFSLFKNHYTVISIIIVIRIVLLCRIYCHHCYYYVAPINVCLRTVYYPSFVCIYISLEIFLTFSRILPCVCVLHDLLHYIKIASHDKRQNVNN